MNISSNQHIINLACGTYDIISLVIVVRFTFAKLSKRVIDVAIYAFARLSECKSGD